MSKQNVFSAAFLSVLAASAILIILLDHRQMPVLSDVPSSQTVAMQAAPQPIGFETLMQAYAIQGELTAPTIVVYMENSAISGVTIMALRSVPKGGMILCDSQGHSQILPADKLNGLLVPE